MLADYRNRSCAGLPPQSFTGYLINIGPFLNGSAFVTAVPLVEWIVRLEYDFSPPIEYPHGEIAETFSLYTESVIDSVPVRCERVGDV